MSVEFTVFASKWDLSRLVHVHLLSVTYSPSPFLHSPPSSLSQLLTYVVSLLILAVIVGHAHLPQALVNL